MRQVQAKPKQNTDDETIMDALADIARDQDKLEKRRRTRQKRLLPAWLEGRVLLIVVVVLVAVTGDGVRRENQEFRAVMTGFEGLVSTRPASGGELSQAKLNQRLGDDAVVETGPGAWATLEFPDGSVLTVDGSTIFTVKLLEYSRGGGWRGRSFFLHTGRVWARVGPYFGAESSQRVYTPSAVAAVRGTQYAVSYDPNSRTTTVQTNEGLVAAENFSGAQQAVIPDAQASISYGQAPTPPAALDMQSKSGFSQEPLNRSIEPPGWWQTVALTITQTLDAPLTILGIGKCSWGVGSADFARRAAAMEGLRYIMQFMEGHEQYPTVVNPATLEELGVDYADARRILKNFDGGALVRFEPMGGHTYRVWARARDRKRTLFLLQPTGITTVEDGGG